MGDGQHGGRRNRRRVRLGVNQSSAQPVEAADDRVQEARPHPLQFQQRQRPGFELVPLTLRKLGADPATASSIFLTTATDVASMGLLLSLATLFLI